jgi:hypothetical protein
VAIWTHPHPEKHSIQSWGLILSPPCGPSAMNHMKYLLMALKWYYWNSYCIIPNPFCIVETTELLIIIDVVCEVSKSLETPSKAIL